jgi:hypothetical protein
MRGERTLLLTLESAMQQTVLDVMLSLDRASVGTSVALIIRGGLLSTSSPDSIIPMSFTGMLVPLVWLSYDVPQTLFLSRVAHSMHRVRGRGPTVVLSAVGVEVWSTCVISRFLIISGCCVLGDQTCSVQSEAMCEGDQRYVDRLKLCLPRLLVGHLALHDMCI